MKKLLLTLVLAVGMFTAANAQLYVGGGLGLNAGNSVSQSYLSGCVGYGLDDSNWGFGTDFSVNYYIDNTYDYSAFAWSFDVYARYAITNVGPLALFADGIIGYDGSNGFMAYVAPGIAYAIDKHWCIATRIGSFGYYGNAFNISASSSIGSFSFFYNF